MPESRGTRATLPPKSVGIGGQRPVTHKPHRCPGSYPGSSVAQGVRLCRAGTSPDAQLPTRARASMRRRMSRGQMHLDEMAERHWTQSELDSREG